MSSAVPSDDSSAQSGASEEAMGEVSAVLLNLEHTIARAKKGLTKVKKSGGDRNVELALEQAIKGLSAHHKRLMQDTYYAGDAVRLL